jgi:hypothetical protein
VGLRQLVEMVLHGLSLARKKRARPSSGETRPSRQADGGTHPKARIATTTAAWNEKTSGVSATRRPTDFGSVRRSQRGIAWANGQVGWAALERGKPQNSPEPVSPGTGNYRRNCTLLCTVLRGSMVALRIGRTIPFCRFFSGEPKALTGHGLCRRYRRPADIGKLMANRQLIREATATTNVNDNMQMAEAVEILGVAQKRTRSASGRLVVRYRCTGTQPMVTDCLSERTSISSCGKRRAQ